MLDIKFIRENKDIVAAGARRKRISVDIDKLLEIDDRRRELQALIDQKRAEQNLASDAITRAGGEERDRIISKMQTLKESLKSEEASLQEVLGQWRAFMVMVPNVPDVTVPEGDLDADNKEVKSRGENPASSILSPKVTLISCSRTIWQTTREVRRSRVSADTF